MADSKVYMFPDSNSGSNSSMDPALLMSMMNNGGFGNGGWIWLIFLWMMWQNGYGNFGGNGAGLGWLGNMMNNNDGRDLLMQAIQNNASAIQNLASMFNTTLQDVMLAINGVSNAITGVSNTVGLSAQQVINNANLGNNAILSALCNLACSLKEAITAGNYQNLIATLNQTNSITAQMTGIGNTLSNEFCRLGYNMAELFCSTRQNSTNNTQSLKDATNAQTLAILAKLDNMENLAMLDKINELTQEKTALSTQINLEHQNAVTALTVANAVNPLIAQLNAVNSKVEAIENKQPTTITTQYQPYTVIPNYGYGYYGNNAWM